MISKTIGKGLAILLLSSPLLAAAQNAVPCTDSTASGHASPVAVWGTGENTYELYGFGLSG